MSAKLEQFDAREQSTLTGSICPTCQNTGWQQLRRANGNPAVRRCPQPVHIAERLALLGVPPRYQDFSLSSFAPRNVTERHARQHLQGFAKQFGQLEKGLIITGSGATGKTHLAIGVMRLLLSESLAQPRFADSSELLRQLDIELNLIDAEQRRYLLDNIINTDLLILDDLVDGGNSEYQQSMFEYIISYRYRHLLPILITTRLSLEELRTAIGSGMFSRLIEMSEFISL